MQAGVGAHKSADAVDRVNPVFSLNARISHLTQGLYSKEAASLGIIAESFAGVSPRIFFLQQHRNGI
jgi:hypothetical protein